MIGYWARKRAALARFKKTGSGNSEIGPQIGLVWPDSLNRTPP
jgi:hypothetical protein